MSDSTVNRRQFASHVAVGAAGAALAGSGLTAAEPPAPRSSADLLLELVMRQYPDPLSPAEITKLRERLERQQTRSQLLSAFPLKNGDEPASTFRAYRQDGPNS